MPAAWAAGAAAVAGLAGSAISADATKSAAKEAAQTQERQYAQMRQDLAPYTEAGTAAVGMLGNYMGLNGAEGRQNALANFQTDPGYRFGVDEGLRAVNANLSAQGMLRSGAALKAVQNRGMQLANQEYGTQLNRLFALSQLGQSSAAGVGNAGITTGSGIAQTQATSAGALSSIYGNAGDTIQNGLQNYALLQRMRQQPTATGVAQFSSTSAPGSTADAYNAAGFTGGGWF